MHSFFLQIIIAAATN